MCEPHGLHVFTFSSPHSIEDWEEDLTEQSPSGTWAKGVPLQTCISQKAKVRSQGKHWAVLKAFVRSDLYHFCTHVIGQDKKMSKSNISM